MSRVRRPADDRPRRPRRPRQKTMTIGAVCKALGQEFPDISISKIRYLEDQKLAHAAAHARRLPALLADRRRPAAHDPAPAARRVPAAAGHPPGARRGARPRASRRRRRAGPRPGPRPRVGAAPRRRHRPRRRRRCTRSRTSSRRRAPSAELVEELEEYGVISGEPRGRRSATTTRPSARSCARSPSWPASASGGRNLRVFRTSADREAALLQQILAPALRSRNPERRREAIEALENLAAVATHLKHLLLIRDLRKIAAEPARARATTSATSRTSRSRGSSSSDITPLLLDARGAGRRGRRPRRLGRARSRSTWWSPPRRAASCSAARSPRSSAPASSPPASRASCPTTPSRPSTSSSTASTRWRCTPTRWRTARGCSSTTTCSRRAGRRRRCASSSSSSAARWSAAPSSIELAFLGGREKLAGSTSTRSSATSASDAYHAPPRVDRGAARAGVGAGRRPVPPAALVAAGRARRGRDGERLTEVLRISKRGAPCGPTGARGERERRLRRWEQELEGTPFERCSPATRSRRELEPADGGTEVTLTLDQPPRGLARLGRLHVAPAMRRQLDEALDGLAPGARNRDRPSRSGAGATRARGPSLPEHAEAFLRAELGIAATSSRRRSRSTTSACPAPALPAAARPAARRSAPLRDDREIRVLRAAGKSYLDLLRQRAGDGRRRPTRSSRPRSADEVVAVLGACAEAGSPSCRSAAGRAWSAASTPLRGGLRRARLARPRRAGRGRAWTSGRCSPGPARDAAARSSRRARRRGLTLGHFPQSYEYATIGGCVATRSAGQASTATGASRSNVVGAALRRAGGAVVDPRRSRPAPPGPTCASCCRLGGRAGRHHRGGPAGAPLAGAARYEGYVSRRSPRAPRRCGRWPRPASRRTSRGSPTRRRRASRSAAAPGRARLGQRALGGALPARSCGWEGEVARPAPRGARRAALPRGGARARPGAPGLKSRYAGPYLRDDLLDRGVLVETLETATTWSQLDEAHGGGRRGALRAALHVGCHISHLYPTGASLYFTALARRRRRPRGAVAAREGRRLRRHRRRRRHDHPPSRRRARPRAVAGAGRPGRRRAAALPEGAPRPGRWRGAGALDDGTRRGFPRGINGIFRHILQSAR